MSEHIGMGGSYVINEAGEKVLVHRTDHPVATATPPVDPVAPTAPVHSTPAAPTNRRTKAAPAPNGTASDNHTQE